jgi:hypothetical protein
MNVLVYELETGKVSGSKKKRVAIEDNIGEGIHIHYGDVRLEMTIDDYLKFCEEMNDSVKKIEQSDYEKVGEGQ